jgi:disulfide bond formation protein DsbB
MSRLQPSERVLRLFFASVALLHLGLGIWLAASPHSFFKTIGAFDFYNRHYERDAATFYLAFAAGGWIAATRPAWRIPVLTLLTVQYALHSINHAVDIDRAHNSWAGPFDVATLSLATIQFVVLLWLLVHRQQQPVRP